MKAFQLASHFSCEICERFTQTSLYRIRVNYITRLFRTDPFVFFIRRIDLQNLYLPLIDQFSNQRM
ncbi:hypothetical protein C4Q31_04315 [Leptospira borgpetersenii serovar Ceylonica]|nr:hypothetical protein C4Q31_04315 [Leptospira borgpetersenii serovar Ceylonica]